MDSEFIYISGKLSEFDWIGREFSRPLKISSGGLMLCTKGSSEIIVDTKRYVLNQWDVVVVFPYSIIKTIFNSEDMECVIMSMSEGFFANIPISNKSQHFTNIKTNPVISLDYSEAKSIISLGEMLQSHREAGPHPYRYEIDDAIFRYIFYETAAIYLKRKPNTEQLSTRDDTIFNTFIYHLFNNFRVHRTLRFYAEMQQITPSHLSKVVQRVSSRSASNWIAQCVVMNVKTELENHATPINMIAEDFNFANASFFSQYFKRYTGLSPNEYRKGLSYIGEF